MATPAAGWYDDPTMANTRRYWDGEKWTDHRQEKAAVAHKPPVPDTKTSTPGWLLRGAAVLFILVAVWLLWGNGLDTIMGGPSVDGTSMELDIEIGLSDQNVTGADISCDDLEHVKQGDVTICEGTDGAGDPISVEVTFNSDGSYVWRKQ